MKLEWYLLLAPNKHILRYLVINTQISFAHFNLSVQYNSRERFA